MKKLILLSVAIAALSACISGQPQQSTYTSPTTGTTTVIQSGSEMCKSSCEADYNRCMDTRAATQSMSSTGFDSRTPPGMFGASRECNNELSSCLSDCKTR